MFLKRGRLAKCWVRVMEKNPGEYEITQISGTCLVLAPSTGRTSKALMIETSGLPRDAPST